MEYSLVHLTCGEISTPAWLHLVIENTEHGLNKKEKKNLQAFGSLYNRYFSFLKDAMSCRVIISLVNC